MDQGALSSDRMRLADRRILFAFDIGLLLWHHSSWGIAVARAENQNAGQSAIDISVPSGFYTMPFQVRIETRGPGAKIYFSTNGAVPSTSTALLYERPIQVKTTTVLRAVAFQGERVIDPIETRTFIFATDVLKQTGAGFPNVWGFTNGQPVRAAYEMNPQIANGRAYHEALLEGLKAIPSLSLVVSVPDLFDATHGLYANPKESGSDWERPAAVEMLSVEGRPGFRINCGLRIQGGWNRRPEESPKHAFRLVFKKGYDKLRFPLFGDEPPTDFDELVLRAGCNNTWLHWNGEERQRGDYIRDQWMRDSFRTMGQPSARGLFVHLYLNGLYWGMYNLTERPNASFAAAHFGGKAKEYDARNGDHILEGDKVVWDRLFSLANSGVTSLEKYQAIGEMVDLPGFCDFMILNFYGGNADWDRSSNWYAARRRKPAGKFHFFIWDGERTLEDVHANTIAFDDDQSPPRLFHKLRESAEFRMLFADRVQRHLFGDGALTPEAAARRYRLWARQLDAPIVAESARWGNYRHDVHPYKIGPYELYTRDQHWRPEIQRLLKEYFPERTRIVLNQFRALGLYPGISPPRTSREDTP